MLKLLQTIFGLAFLFYLIRGLSGKMRDGDFLKGGICFVVALFLIAINNNLIKFG